MDAEKVSLVEYQLRGNANHWWRATKITIFLKGMEVTWTGFVKAFFGKHFSNCAWDNKMMEFMQLN